MCGIFGFFGRATAARPNFERWGAALRHRGPDDAGMAHEHHEGRVCVLGHRRLSIIDLSPAGHQPMQSADGRYVAVFNGEVYNFRALREQLEAVGERFQSRSDTEVLIAAYARWREGALERLRGMFAFAIWDRQRGTLFLARDRVGVKPLYVARVDGTVLFASEVRSLLASGLVPRLISRDAVASYLAFGSVYEPQSIVAGVVSLAPGSWIEIGPSSERAGRYYSLPTAAPLSATSDEMRARLRATLSESVRLRLEADVPVGVFLSGGIDSAVVASLAAQAATSPLHTFTVTFDEAEWDERAPARALAERLGTVHHEAELVTSQIATQIELAVAALDQPSSDGINTFFVSRAARAAGLSVALSGIGGDELFAGYSAFRTFALATRLGSFARALPQGVQAFLEGVEALPRLPIRIRKGISIATHSADPIELYGRIRGMFLARQRERLLPGAASSWADEQLASRVRDGLKAHTLDPSNAYGALELAHYMRNTLLRDTDAMSMAHSLEVREPLLDHELIDLALRAPAGMKFDGIGNKPLLTSVVPEVPERARTSAKKGFTLPFERWMKTTLREWVRERVANGVPGLERHEVERLWRSYLRNDGEVTWARIWSLAVLSDYCDRHALAVQNL